MSSLAQKLIEQTCEKQNIQPGQLTIHAGRGSSMKSKPVAFLTADLGITKSHSRPYVSNDNPYSESHFKTLKYRPEFPERFGSIVDARLFCQPFFYWYNGEHYHSGIGFLTPEDVHYGRAEQVVKERQAAWMLPMKRTQNDSREKRQRLRNFPQPSGLTNRRYKIANRRYTKLLRDVSHFH